MPPVVTTSAILPWGGRGVAAAQRDGRALVAVADASTCGFDVDHKSVADPCLADLVAWWLDGGAPASTELAVRTRAHLARLREEARPASYEEGFPVLHLLVLEARAATASVHWIGGSVAQLVRDGAVVEQTPPHLLGATREELAAAPELAVLSSRQATPDATPAFDSVTWCVRPGDVVLVLDHLAIARAAWWPLPASWPPALDLDAVVASARAAHARAAHAGAVGGKPPFAGTFTLIRW